MPADVDRLFRVFRRTGSPRAIAAVYDRLAPQLLALAAHLGHRRDDAEDLVQATFLTVIECADDFDAARPVTPWIVGILANRARAAHRRRRRRPDAACVVRHDAADPAEVAADHEQVERLQRVVAGLPEPYRSALVLRLVHDFAPVEIAHALGVSPQTVKTRLRRGRALLRNALPNGLVPAFVLASLHAAPGLAVGRAAVVRQALRRLGFWSALASRLRLAAASPRGVLAGVAAALAVAAATALWPEAAAVVQPTPAAGTAGTAVAAVTRDGAARLAPGTAVRRAMAAPVAPALRVRWSDGAAAGGVWVSATPVGAADPGLVERWFCTDADGLVPQPASLPGRVVWAAERGGSTTGAILTIPRGVDVHGRVRAHGVPVAGAAIWVTRREVATEGHEVVRTAADGSYSLRSLEPGRAITVFAAGFAAPALRQVHFTPQRASVVDFDLVSAPAALVEGRVEDEGGRPIAGALVQIGAARTVDLERDLLGQVGVVPPPTVRSEDDGSFRCAHFAPGALLAVWAGAAGFAPCVRHLATTATTTVRTTLVLTSTRRLSGTVRDQRHRPLSDVLVSVRDAGVDGPLAPRWTRTRVLTATDGTFAIDVPHREGVDVRATANDGRTALAPIDALRTGRWEPLLPPLLACAGRVSADDGTPLAAVSVEILTPTGQLAAVTSSDGRFELRCPDRGPFTLVVRDPASIWTGPLAVVAGVVPDAELELRVAPAASTLAGRIVDARGTPVGAGVQLTTSDGSAYLRSDPLTGTFRFERLPATRSSGGYVLRAQSHDGALALVAGPFEVRAGETCQLEALELQATNRLIARIVDADTRPIADGAATIETATGAVAVAALPVREGRLTSPRLPVGEYVARLVSGGASFRFAIDAAAPTRATWQHASPSNDRR